MFSILPVSHPESLQISNMERFATIVRARSHYHCIVLYLRYLRKSCICLCLPYYSPLMPRSCVISKVSKCAIHILGTSISKLPAGNYMFKVNYKKTRKRCEICSKLTIKTPERHQWTSFLSWTLNIFHT